MPNAQSLVPRILLTNDDGIQAPGLKALERIAKALSKDVWTVAPEQEQSGAGHSLTLHMPLRLRKLAAHRYAISGTPTDCVLLAIKEVIPVKRKRVDVILSGINRGSNVGDDITYSGTVAAAMEGTILGVPSIALSQLHGDADTGDACWTAAEHYAPAIIAKLMAIGWPKDTLININFPSCAIDQVKGVRVCAQGKRKVGVALTSRVDPKGRPYFWLGGERDNTPSKSGVDIDLLYAGHITVTPIRMEMTDYDTMPRIAEAVE